MFILGVVGLVWLERLVPKMTYCVSSVMLNSTIHSLYVWVCMCVCVCVYVSFMSIGCMYHEYDRWTSDVDKKRQRRRFFPRIWTRSGLIHGDPKFGQGLGISPLYRWSASVCMGRVWLSCQLVTCITDTTYALATEWWFWYQPATSPFRRRWTRNIRIGVCVCVC